MLFSRRATAWFALGALCLTPGPVFAQDTSRPFDAKSDSREVRPDTSEVEALYAASFDIPRLRALNELALTDEQLDQLILMVNETQKAYQKQLREMASKTLGKVSKELKKAKKDGLLGKPADFDAETLKVLGDYPKKVASLDQEYIVLYTVKLKQVLTKTQVAAAARFARTEQRKTSPDAKGTDDQWYNFYVNGIFPYPRLLPLLQEMQTARKAPKEKVEIPEPPNK